MIEYEPSSVISTAEELRALYGEASPRALIKELDHVSPHYQQFIEASPFAVIGSVGPEGLDTSPRGDPPPRLPPAGPDRPRRGPGPGRPAEGRARRGQSTSSNSRSRCCICALRRARMLLCIWLTRDSERSSVAPISFMVICS